MKEQPARKLYQSASAQLRDAIQKGDKEKALQLLEEKDKGARTIVHAVVTQVDLLQKTLGERVGEAAIGDVQALFNQLTVRNLFPSPDEPAEKKLERRLQVWTMYHNVDVEVEEDAEKYTLTYYCPTGGMLRASGKEYGRTKEPHVWSQGKKDICYFCTHCTTAFELESINKFGVPDWITVPLEDGRCSQIIYKDRRYIPEEYYRRVGKTKPQSTIGSQKP